MENNIILEEKRYKHNILMFILSFLSMNLISGIVYDTYINYLQEVAIGVSTSFWSYYGYATFIAAIILLFINRFGYKKILLLCPLLSSTALGSILFLNHNFIYEIMTLLVLIAIQLHHAIISPYLASFTRPDNRTYWYSMTYWTGYLGWAITTYLGGLLTVLSFSARTGNTLSWAKEISKHIDLLSPLLKLDYLKSNEDVLLLSFIISLLSFIPVALIRERPCDYGFLEDRPNFNLKNYFIKTKDMMNKYSLAFIAYLAIVNFSMGLFSPYFTIYLNRYLHIDRSTSSLLVALSYLATVVFLVFTPRLSYRFGQIKTLGLSVLMSIPFMIIIPIVGLALFLRSGLANLGGPIESSLPMEIVNQEERTYMSSLTYILAGLMSIVSGSFTGNILFKLDLGYKYGYYIASLMYLLAVGILFKVFLKDYNHMKKDRPN